MNYPKVSAVFAREHEGETVISFEGQILGFGKDILEALKHAKSVDPQVEEKSFLISKIYGPTPKIY